MLTQETRPSKAKSSIYLYGTNPPNNKQTCIVISVVWHNKVIQASDLNLDMKVANIESLFAQLVALRNSWKAIWNKAKLVASSLQIEVQLFRHGSTAARKRIRFHDEDTPDENVNEMNEADKSP